ncbi:hypothetical protein PRIC1_004973 [Phytophthora ramorum]
MSQSSAASGLKPDANASRERNVAPDKSRDVPTRGKLKRKAKRLVWTEELHLRFVSAVFELGVKNASPKALLDLMEAKDPTEGLTPEHIKSHLQKYRINYERSRLEVQRLNEKHAKRSLKRHHRHRGTVSSDDGAVESSARSTDQWIPPMDTALPQATTQQWNMCDALLLNRETTDHHMHFTMQQRMDFHRELLLTRSVEVASGLSWANRMSDAVGAGIDSNSAIDDSSFYRRQEAENASFLQAWANAEQLRQQEDQVYGRLHQQQQSLFSQQQDTVPAAPFSVGGSRLELPSRVADERMEADGGVDLSSWGRLSLTVDSDDDDVFGFLDPKA